MNAALLFLNFTRMVAGPAVVRKLINLFGFLTDPFLPLDFNTIRHEAELRGGSLWQIDSNANPVPDEEASMLQLLRALMDSYEAQAHNLLIPKYVVREQIFGWAVSGLRINKYIHENPQVLSVSIKRPLIITGLWRTGTTLLHSLLSLDPACRSFQLWEMMKPIPPPEPKTYSSNPRIHEAHVDISFIEHLTSHAHKHIHNLTVTSPEECTFMFFNDLVIFQYYLTEVLPGYCQHLVEKHDMASSYSFYRRALQVLSSKFDPKDHLTLKSPFPHLWNLPILLSTFPDACVVICHRHPLEVVPSTISLNSSFMSSMWKNYTANKAANRILDITAAGANGAVKFRQSLEPQVESQHFFDVYFDEFVNKPEDIVKRIYDHFGYEYTQAFDERVKDWLKNNTHMPSKKHEYSLSEFGLESDQVQQHFSYYLSKHFPNQETKTEAKKHTSDHINHRILTTTSSLEVQK